MTKDLSWETKSLLFIKEMIEIRIFRFFNFFSKVWKIRERYKANKIGDKAEPCPTTTSILKKEKEKLFQSITNKLLTGCDTWT